MQISKQITQIKKCPICKSKVTIKGKIVNYVITMFMVDSSTAYMADFCTKECFEEGKKRGMWK